MTANSFALKLTNPSGGGAERAESLSRRPVKLTARPADCTPLFDTGKIKFDGSNILSDKKGAQKD